MTQSLEERTDAKIKEFGITPHITHLKQSSVCYYSHITVATIGAADYRLLDITTKVIFMEAAVKQITGSALDALIVARFAKCGVGVSPCHARDNFSRKRGRIIAKGRLLKLLRAQA